MPLRPIDQILELARWAPSGDNTQPWRFEVPGERHAVVHGFDTRAHCVYDLDGHPSQLSIGALIETASIAASAHGWRMEATRRPESAETHPVFDLRFTPDPSVRIDELIESIRRRSVQRRPLQTRALTADEVAALEGAVAPSHSVLWRSSPAMRRRAALLLFRSAKLRLVMPEAYRVHRDVIEWNARFSVDRVPDQALGVDVGTTRLMRFVMTSWERVAFFNRFLAGTWLPRLQMDLLPALACGAHFLLLSARAPSAIDDYVAAGRAVQRFWLMADRLGLQLQPEVTPLVFARYARVRRPFSATPGMARRADAIAADLEAFAGVDASRRAVFMGRIGAGTTAEARSLRLDLTALAQPPASGAIHRV